MTETLPSSADIREELYRRGNLAFKLDTLQKQFHSFIHNGTEKISVILSSRRLGKSWFASVLAIEQCLMQPNSVVKFVAPTKLMINSILRPLFKEILKDCPSDLAPKNLRNQFSYVFPNGSIIELAASNGGHADKLRGSFAHLCIIDEAQNCDDLENTVRSVLVPTTLNTKGKIILIGTPPESTDHEFMKFVEDAEARKSLMKKNIYSNPRITPDEIGEILKAYPNGVKNLDFRREFLCEIQKNLSTAVIPEFTPELELEIVKDWPKPPFFDAYESMDLGFKDLTVVLFGYYDFRAAKLIIEDELVVLGHQMQLPELVNRIKEKEKQLWTNPLADEVKKPALRVSDINYIVTQELNRVSGGEVNFLPTPKHDKDAALNNVRTMLANKKIIIHPRCETLLRHLRNVKYKSVNQKTIFSRSSDNGHYDAVDALIYLCRSVNYNQNPYPPHYELSKKDLFLTNPSSYRYSSTGSSNVDVFAKVFKNIKPMNRG